MDCRYNNVRKKLSDLGYNKYVFKLDSLLLVEKLLGDLIETTDNLRKFKKIARETIEERDNLQFGAEPYKCANAKLVKECNELHLAFLQVKEQNEKHQKDLKKRISLLEKEKNDILEINKKQEKRIRDLQLNVARKTDRTLKFESKHSETKLRSCSTTALSKSTCPNKKREFEISSTMALAEQKIASLCKETCKLKEQMLDIVECNESLKDKLINRDREIKRLSCLLEYGVPVRDCDDFSKQNEHIIQQKIKMECEEQVKEARAKQHEAMKHALQLAERNHKLEQELRDIDQIALQVEAECNSTVEENSDKVTRLHERLQETVIRLQSADNEAATLRRERKLLVADIETINGEKRKLRECLENTMQENKMLNDKVKNFKIIEHDLNLEIDRLASQTTNEKRMVADLKGKLLTDTYRHNSTNENRRNSTDMCPDECVKKLKEIVEKEMNHRFPEKSNSIERVRKERDFYINEYQAVVKQLRESSTKDNYYATDNIDNDKRVKDLQSEVTKLIHERNELNTKLIQNSASKLHEDYSHETMSSKASQKRIERERDLLKADLDRLQDSNDSLKQKIKTACDRHTIEIENHQQLLHDHALKIQKLEFERHDLQKSDGHGRDTISRLEDNCRSIKEELRKTKEELLLSKTAYNQLKALLEQTDKALSISQREIATIENESRERLNQKETIDNEKSALQHEIELLKNDIKIMTKNLNEIESEKDKLLMIVDTKTEDLAKLTIEMREKEAIIKDVNNSNRELEKKMSLTMDKSVSRDLIIRNSQADIKRIELELESSLKVNENIVKENRRLQSDLAACTVDSRRCHTELEIAKREIDDLKRQLQHYVAEVKKIQDMLSVKEIERSDLLNQFKNVSHEATVLETNNHSLEHEMSQTKVQLTVCMDHATDLEKRLQEHKTLIRDYEKQISDMTKDIASLEMQQKGYGRVEKDLDSAHDVVVKLDKQKDALVRQLENCEREKLEISRNLERLRKDRDRLEEDQNKGSSAIEKLEDLLKKSRNETVEYRLINQEMHNDILRLKSKVEDLQNKIEITTSQLDLYQEKAVEYSQQNKQLRREIVNERFFISKEEESTSSKSHKISSLVSSELCRELKEIEQNINKDETIINTHMYHAILEPDIESDAPIKAPLRQSQARYGSYNVDDAESQIHYKRRTEIIGTYRTYKSVTNLSNGDLTETEKEVRHRQSRTSNADNSAPLRFEAEPEFSKIDGTCNTNLHKISDISFTNQSTKFKDTYTKRESSDSSFEPEKVTYEPLQTSKRTPKTQTSSYSTLSSAIQHRTRPSSPLYNVATETDFIKTHMIEKKTQASTNRKSSPVFIVTESMKTRATTINDKDREMSRSTTRNKYNSSIIDRIKHIGTKHSLPSQESDLSWLRNNSSDGSRIVNKQRPKTSFDETNNDLQDTKNRNQNNNKDKREQTHSDGTVKSSTRRSLPICVPLCPSRMCNIEEGSNGRQNISKTRSKNLSVDAPRKSKVLSIDEILQTASTFSENWKDLISRSYIQEPKSTSSSSTRSEEKVSGELVHDANADSRLDPRNVNDDNNFKIVKDAETIASSYVSPISQSDKVCPTECQPNLNVNLNFIRNMQQSGCCKDCNCTEKPLSKVCFSDCPHNTSRCKYNG